MSEYALYSILYELRTTNALILRIAISLEELTRLAKEETNE